MGVGVNGTDSKVGFPGEEPTSTTVTTLLPTAVAVCIGLMR